MGRRLPGVMPEGEMEQLTRFDGLNVVSGPAWSDVVYFCTTRHGGVSGSPWESLNVGPHTGDVAAHVEQNRQRLARALPAPVFWIRQVHGTEVIDVDRLGPQAALADRLSADGLVTACDNVVLGIMTADCLPVVLGSSDGRVIGLAHAGWRGLAAGILENIIIALTRKHPDDHAQWRAWIGPGITQANFEVGADVRNIFVEQDHATSDFFTPSSTHRKWLADLAGIAQYRLTNLGVSQIDTSSLCTYDRRDLFYSYRRATQTGRMATFAWRTVRE